MIDTFQNDCEMKENKGPIEKTKFKPKPVIIPDALINKPINDEPIMDSLANNPNNENKQISFNLESIKPEISRRISSDLYEPPPMLQSNGFSADEKVDQLDLTPSQLYEVNYDDIQMPLPLLEEEVEAPKKNFVPDGIKSRDDAPPIQHELEKTNSQQNANNQEESKQIKKNQPKPVIIPVFPENEPEETENSSKTEEKSEKSKVEEEYSDSSSYYETDPKILHDSSTEMPDITEDDRGSEFIENAEKPNELSIDEPYSFHLPRIPVSDNSMFDNEFDIVFNISKLLADVKNCK